MSTANGTAIATIQQPATLTQPGRLEFTAEQRQMIRDTFANGASDGEFAVLMEVARARNLNPLLRQIHFVDRWDSNKGRKVWSTQISIDGLRAVAERTGRYDGQDEPEFDDKDGRVVACRVRVYRKGISRAFVGVAHWAEYVQTKKDGSPTAFWQRMPHVMLAKCAEALAIRKAFPEDTAGLYVAEEMGSDAPVTVAPPQPAHTPKPLPAAVDAEAVEVLTQPADGEPGPTERLEIRISECQTQADLAALLPEIKASPYLDTLRGLYNAKMRALKENA